MAIEIKSWETYKHDRFPGHGIKGLMLIDGEEKYFNCVSDTTQPPIKSLARAVYKAHPDNTLEEYEAAFNKAFKD
jgi:hypothetical protein